MNIFEWLVERRKPNAMGKISVDNLDDFQKDIPLFWQIIIVLFGFAGIGWFFWITIVENEIMQSWKAIVVFAVYLLIARYIKSKPNMRNMGLFGGLINHPFRYSDNINRMLFLLEAILFPGKIMVAALQIVWKFLKR
ncbi:MAG: hypothetical protein ACOVNY_03185 [Chitinophagaceae bacterium]